MEDRHAYQRHAESIVKVKAAAHSEAFLRPRWPHMQAGLLRAYDRGEIATPFVELARAAAVLSSSSSVHERAKLAAFRIREFIAKRPNLDDYLNIGKTVRNLLGGAAAANLSAGLQVDSAKLPSMPAEDWRAEWESSVPAQRS